VHKIRRVQPATVAVIILVAVALLAACTSKSQQAGSGSGQGSALEAAQQALAPSEPTLGGQRYGDMLVWLTSRPAQPLRGTAEMDAYLVGTGGEPITDARVTFDADMTNMSHGLYLVPAEPTGAGHYIGNVRFLMPGPWRVLAIVERPGREAVKLRFEFTVNSK
jgi:hypothetical protein